ncbi:MAG: hypothetical protein EZS28_017756 [Streblomastix strix]|uniref:Uncharacterized protein n=1 Tax=Streblomastix strix TaxID=222440 RepID=A0A5J4VX35_9EUKA|nr:MAG: hypothetical protein EZS28_017756 [Streblomastix strix]
MDYYKLLRFVRYYYFDHPLKIDVNVDQLQILVLLVFVQGIELVKTTLPLYVHAIINHLHIHLGYLKAKKYAIRVLINLYQLIHAFVQEQFIHLSVRVHSFHNKYLILQQGCFYTANYQPDFCTCKSAIHPDNEQRCICDENEDATFNLDDCIETQKHAQVTTLQSVAVVLIMDLSKQENANAHNCIIQMVVHQSNELINIRNFNIYVIMNILKIQMNVFAHQMILHLYLAFVQQLLNPILKIVLLMDTQLILTQQQQNILVTVQKTIIQQNADDILYQKIYIIFQLNSVNVLLVMIHEKVVLVQQHDFAKLMMIYPLLVYVLKTFIKIIAFVLQFIIHQLASATHHQIHLIIQKHVMKFQDMRNYQLVMKKQDMKEVIVIMVIPLKDAFVLKKSKDLIGVPVAQCECCSTGDPRSGLTTPGAGCPEYCIDNIYNGSCACNSDLTDYTECEADNAYPLLIDCNGVHGSSVKPNTCKCIDGYTPTGCTCSKDAESLEGVPPEQYKCLDEDGPRAGTTCPVTDECEELILEPNDRECFYSANYKPDSCQCTSDVHPDNEQICAKRLKFVQEEHLLLHFLLVALHLFALPKNNQSQVVNAQILKIIMDIPNHNVKQTLHQLILKIALKNMDNLYVQTHANAIKITHHCDAIVI